MLLVELHLGLGQESLISFARQDLLFGRWQLECPLAIHLHHTLLECFGRCLLLLKLLAVKLFGLGFIVLGLDFGEPFMRSISALLTMSEVRVGFFSVSSTLTIAIFASSLLALALSLAKRE
jgi:membrane protein required for beta-lactamase induction